MLPALLDELRRGMGARVTGSELAFCLRELAELEAQASRLQIFAFRLSTRSVSGQLMPLRIDGRINGKR